MWSYNSTDSSATHTDGGSGVPPIEQHSKTYLMFPKAEKRAK